MLLRTDQLTKNYGRFRALDRLDLELGAGEIFGLLGPNGSGKSTALRLMLGFLQPTSGHATIAGHECWHHGVEARRHVAYLPGELRLYENMTGRQLVRFLGGLRGPSSSALLPPGGGEFTAASPPWTSKGEDEGRLEKLAATFDIDISRPIANLSSGMKRKVALLQVLLPRTQLIILDEPTNTLDPTMRDELLRQLVEARQQGQAVLFSSHVLAEVEKVCDRVGILQRGKLVHVQKMSELREVRRVQAVFADVVKFMPNLPGLRRCEMERERLTCEYEGPLPALLEWLGREKLVDLQIQPLGLTGIYRQYHGIDA